MTFDRFTQRAGKALNLALQSAAELGHSYIGTEHLLLGLLRAQDGVAAQVLRGKDITVEKAVRVVADNIGVGSPSAVTPQDMTPRVKKILETSYYEARNLQNNYVGTEHILLALLREQGCKADEILEELGVSVSSLYDELVMELSESTGGAGQPDYGAAGGGRPAHSGGKDGALGQYGRDLTELARAGEIDPVIGREKEISRIIQILSRRTKNNPCLIGEPGVGKTAVAEGLAIRIVEGNVPETLKDKRVVALDLGSMIAGAKYRGEFEDRLKNVMAEIAKAKNVILFIDELHTIVGAGAAEGAVDAANILKPPLSRGEIQVIGATTLDEYRKHIEKDAALERRFQPVTVGEPTEEESVEILKGLRDRYEAHHKVKITDSALEAAVKLSARYITDRFLPDKAIDLMDEAASKERLKTLTPPPALKEMEDKLVSLAAEKEEAIQNQEFERAATLRDQEKELKQQVESAKKDWQSKDTSASKIVDETSIAGVISEWTGIPLNKLAETESERLLHMEDILHERVVGQDDAVTAVAKAIRRGRVGLKDPRRPVGSFLFLGPTGVGKTELSKALAEAMFGSENALIRIDMSEYMEKHTVSRLIGSPPGYVGYDDAGQLTEKVRRKPYSIVLFDEVEKAHPDVFNILLQILDDGMLTDSHGKKVDFKNTVIIMTSNIGAQTIAAKGQTLGFGDKTDSFEKTQDSIKSNIMGELRRMFRPELLNRIDDIIVFKQLTESDIEQITRLMLKSVTQRMRDMEIEVSFTDEAVKHLAKTGYDVTYGARPLKRAIQSQVEDKLAEQFLDGSLKGAKALTVGFDGGKLTFEPQAQQPQA